MSVDVILWLIRVWSILAGSSCIPCLFLFIIFGKLDHKAYKQLRLYFLLSGITKFLLVSVAMILPTSGAHIRLSLDSQYFLVLYLWMIAVLAHAISTWSVMFSMIEIKRPTEATL